jgi:hypothetical protein
LALVLEIEPLTEAALLAQRKEGFVISVQSGHVARATEVRDRATLNALIEDLLKKSTEGHHDDFARVEPDYWAILLTKQGSGLASP